MEFKYSLWRLCWSFSKILKILYLKLYASQFKNILKKQPTTTKKQLTELKTPFVYSRRSILVVVLLSVFILLSIFDVRWHHSCRWSRNLLWFGWVHVFYRSTFTGTVQDGKVFTVTALSCSKRNGLDFKTNTDILKMLYKLQKGLRKNCSSLLGKFQNTHRKIWIIRYNMGWTLKWTDL